MDGIDSAKFTDNTAEIGTLAHAMITDALQGRMTDTSDFDSRQIEDANWCVKSWDAWSGGKKIEPVLIEAPLVSEQYRYGGTCDIYAGIDGIKTLLDLKSGSDLWPEFHIQVAAYRQLLCEVGHEVDQVRILNIPRSKTETFQEVILSGEVLDLNWELFTHLLRVYQLKKELKW